MRSRFAVSFAAIAAIFAGACSADRSTFLVPFAEGDQSALIVVQAAGALDVFAVDETSRSTMPILRSLDAETAKPLRITAIFYPTTLAAQSFQPGLLSLANDPSEGRALPTAMARIEALDDSDGDGSAQWTSLDRLPAELAALRLPGAAGCVRLNVKNVTLAGEKLIAGGAPLDDSAAIVAVATNTISDPVFYRIDEAGAHPLPRAGAIAGFRPLRATGNRSAFYLSGTLNGTTAIALRTPLGEWGLLTQRPPNMSDRLVRAMRTPPEESEDGALLYTVSERGDLGRYISEPLREAHWENQGANPEDRSGTEVGLGWISAGEVYFIAPDGKDIIHYRGKVYERETTDLEVAISKGEDGFRSLLTIPELETSWAGTYRGNILERTSESWTRIRTGEATAAIFALAPFRAGFVAGTNDGQVIQWDPRAHFCEEDAVYLNGNVEVSMIVELRDMLVVGGVALSTGEVTVALVQPASN